jgi:hypothetical protein
MVTAVRIEFGGGHVQGERDLLSGNIPGFFNRGHEQPQGLLIGVDRRGKTAFIAHGARPAPVLDHEPQMVEDLRRPTDRFHDGGAPDRHDHVLLEIRRVTGVLAAVEQIDLRTGIVKGPSRDLPRSSAIR